MNNLNGRSVRLVRMQTAVHINSYGQLGTPLIPEGKGKLQLTLCEYGVHAKGVGPTGIRVEFVIPIANCQSIELSPEAE